MSIMHKAASAGMWTLGRLLPVQKNKIVISSYYGRGYGDNAKPIVEELLKRTCNLDIVWMVNDDAAAETLPSGVRPVKNTLWNRIRELCTAKIWIDNCRKGARVKKQGQWYLQTWHGFALKRIEKDAAASLPADYPQYAGRDSAQTDLIVSNSALMTKIYNESFWYHGEVLEFGSPRNDVFFVPAENVKEKVRAALDVPEDCFMVLYAPTFRADGSMDAYSVDYARLQKALAERFGGKWVALIRLHPNVMSKAKDLDIDGINTFDATRYDDMQELLAAADAVISDYSSLMFDYGLTKRPCFQFATDIAAYEKDRNFYFPLRKMPFPLAQNNDALESVIQHWEQDEAEKAWDAFCAEFGICEDGKASARCVDWILEKMKG